MNQQKKVHNKNNIFQRAKVAWMVQQMIRKMLVAHLVKGDLLTLGFNDGTTESLHSLLGVS